MTNPDTQDHGAEAQQVLADIYSPTTESDAGDVALAQAHATLALVDEVRALREQGIRLAAFTPPIKSGPGTGGQEW